MRNNQELRVPEDADQFDRDLRGNIPQRVLDSAVTAVVALRSSRELRIPEDADQFDRDLRGGSATVVREYGAHTLSKAAPVVTAAALGAGIVLPATSAAAARAPMLYAAHKVVPKHNVPSHVQTRTIETIQPAGATLDGLGQARASQTGESVRAAIRDIWRANHDQDPLMHGRTIKLPIPANASIDKLTPEGVSTLWRVAEMAVNSKNDRKIIAEVKIIERADGLTEVQTTMLPDGFEAIVPHLTEVTHDSTSTSQVSKTKAPVPSGKEYKPSTSGSVSTSSKEELAPTGGTQNTTSATHVKTTPTEKSKTVPKFTATPNAEATTPTVHHVTPPSAERTSTATPSAPPASPAQATPAETTPSQAPATPGQPPKPIHHRAHESSAPVVISTQPQPVSEVVKKHHKKHGPSAAELLKWECSPHSMHTLIGGNRELKAIHYFMLCNGDSLAGATGMVGNMEHEDVGLDPERIQNGAGDTRHPATTGQAGWGIAQWTPGSKASLAAKEVGIPNIYTLRSQLQLIAYETNHVSPTGAQDINAQLQKATDPSAAAQLFEQEFEAPAGGGNLPNRQALAEQAVQEYQSLHPHGYSPKPTSHAHHHKLHHHKEHKPAVGAAATSSPAAPSASPKQPHPKVRRHLHQPAHHKHRNIPHAADVDHTSPNAAIYFSALEYDTASYSESMIAGHEGVKRWHQDFPQIGPSALVDCSGLVNLAVSTATGGRVQLNDNTTTELTDSANWQRIPFTEAKRGDLIQPKIGDPHVEIINYIQGDNIYTFGAHTSQVAQPDQVGPAEYIDNSADVFLRYVGAGAPLGTTIESPPPPAAAVSQPPPMIATVPHHRHVPGHHHARHTTATSGNVTTPAVNGHLRKKHHIHQTKPKLSLRPH